MDNIDSTISLTSRRRDQRPRLVIVEQHTSVADLLDAGLWGEYRVRSVITSAETSVAATVAAARATRPQVAIVSSRPAPLVDGEGVISALAAAGVPVIALTAVGPDEDPVHWGRCLLAGAVGALAMTDDLAGLRRALELALTGRPSLCPALAARLQELAREAAGTEHWRARARLESLSPRELQVIGKLMTGRGPMEIAREDFVSAATVRSQVKSILAKLEVSSQLSAVALARLAGLPVTQESVRAA